MDQKTSIKKVGSETCLFGIKGLAEFLGVSEPTASKLAHSGRFPVYERGRTSYMFLASEVLIALKKETPEGSRGKKSNR